MFGAMTATGPRWGQGEREASGNRGHLSGNFAVKEVKTWAIPGGSKEVPDGYFRREAGRVSAREKRDHGSQGGRNQTQWRLLSGASRLNLRL